MWYVCCIRQLNAATGAIARGEAPKSPRAARADSTACDVEELLECPRTKSSYGNGRERHRDARSLKTASLAIAEHTAAGGSNDIALL